MITLNNRTYKLVLIDTCIVSELFKRKGDFSKGIIEFLVAGRIPCFAIETIKELKSAPDLFIDFFNLFTFFPSFILKDLDSLLEEEINNYANNNIIDPILIRLSKDPRKQESFDIISFVNSYLTDNYITKFKDGQKIALEGILGLKPNYKPKNKSYSKSEIENFVEIVTYQQLVNKYITWCKQMNESKKTIDINKFPSLQIQCYLVFYKFYINNRKPKLSDIPDILMASLYPYVDEVITEKNQAEILRQIQNKHNLFTNLLFYTIKDFI
jgi:hypothetical protein